MPISNYVPTSALARPGVCTSTTRPASPFEGQAIYETDTDKTYIWNGSLWVEQLSTTVIDAKGDLIVGTAADTASRLAVGTNNHVLVADSAQSTGAKWASIEGTLRMAAGGTYGGAVATVITFPSGRFSAAPFIMINNPFVSSPVPYITAISATQFTYQNSVGSNQDMRYIAWASAF
jgi:hypothetical protein